MTSVAALLRSGARNRQVRWGLALVLTGPVSGAVAQRAPARFSLPPSLYEPRLVRSVLIPARDGVTLSTDLYFPVGAPEPWPAILLRTPYGKSRISLPSITRFVERGYVVAVQDVRGKFESGGNFTISGSDRSDGYDTIEWLSRQRWSNSRVGTWGCSYLGETQLTAASARHPAHAAMVPMAASNAAEMAGVFKGGAWRGGALELSSAADWLRRAGAKVRPVLGPVTDSAGFAAAARNFDLAPKAPEADFVGMLKSLPLLTLLDRMGAAPSDWNETLLAGPAGLTAMRRGLIQPQDQFDTPALFVDSWYDYGVANALRLFNRLRSEGLTARTRDNVFAVIGPSTHCGYERVSEHTMVGHRELDDARFDFPAFYLRWFDRWVRGVHDDMADVPPLHIFVMGRNAWRGESEWPLARTRWTKYYLRSGGRANSRHGDGSLSTVAPGKEPADSFTYDPATPVPSMGGPDFGASNPLLPPGGLDQRPVEARADVLVFTTPPLDEGVEVTGPIRLRLFVSSDARDTDFTGKLVDVYPDGRAFNVQEGIFRVRYREGYERTAWMELGRVYEIEIDLEATSNWFAPGHRIRLEVSSSNFPRFDRNLNTGGDNVTEVTWRVARNVVHHSANYPSHLLLPVIPASPGPIH